jgi:hypothetical protein
VELVGKRISDAVLMWFKYKSVSIQKTANLRVFVYFKYYTKADTL